MKIKLYGTAAAEGIPALFCNCSVCKNAQKVKGKEIRSRSQSMIDDTILIDLPPDTFLHKIYHDMPLSNVEHLLVTHSHHDHFIAEELMMRMAGYGNDLDNKLYIYGNRRIHEMIERASNIEGRYDPNRLQYEEVFEIQPFNVANYKVTAHLADHDKKEKCFLYQIEKDNKAVFFGHDSGYFPEAVWRYWSESKVLFNLVILDCTNQVIPGETNHMSFQGCVDVKNRMLKEGYANLETEFVITHFSHNGTLTHKETKTWAQSNGFTAAYDGIVLNIK